MAALMLRVDHKVFVVYQCRYGDHFHIGSQQVSRPVSSEAERSAYIREVQVSKS